LNQEVVPHEIVAGDYPDTFELDPGDHQPEDRYNHPTVNLLGWQPTEIIRLKAAGDFAGLGVTHNHFDSGIDRFLYNDRVMEYVSTKLRSLNGAKPDDGPHRSKMGSMSIIPETTVSSKNEVSPTVSFAYSELFLTSHKKITPAVATMTMAWHFRLRKDSVMIRGQEREAWACYWFNAYRAVPQE
jgi:hypothetical protein